MNDSAVPLTSPSDPSVGFWSTSLESSSPSLTSESCARSLSALFQDPFLLTLATEASSHPSGIESLIYQPYVYAGGGLGNIDECPLQTCVAGAGVRRDSINFASACVPFACRAEDLAADDFNATLFRISLASVASLMESNARGTDNLTSTFKVLTLNQEYVTLMERISEINRFLGTGWTCGEFKVPWQMWPWGYLYALSTAALILLSLVGTLRTRYRLIQPRKQDLIGYKAGENYGAINYGSISNQQWDALDQDDQAISPRGVAEMANIGDNNNNLLTSLKDETVVTELTKKSSCRLVNSESDSIWKAFDFSQHLERLTARDANETACFDGLRVGSVSWIMLGHVMAITSTSGAGFANPAAFLPPHGVTTSVAGQLIFSSRFAVDTFLCISGFLVVHVLQSKFPFDKRASREATPIRRYLAHIPGLAVARVARILPIYALALGFYTQIAPHMGHGPFWYQWLALLRPCHDYAWTNLLFVNNFVPVNTATTETCFYHSWYLAVDMQLFLAAPLLIFVYQRRPALGLKLTSALFTLSVAITSYLTYLRGWSSNTFDGAAVARFDVEAYSKPHIRVQSYLAGMFVGMTLPRAVLASRSSWTWMHRVGITVALLAMIFVTFVPATGAYSRRPCQYQEWPYLDECGSLWSARTTFLYTAFGRTFWSISVAALMHFTLGRHHTIATILSWKCWAPLSRLSYAVYLIHPTVIFVWQLGNSSKQVFRLETFAMDYLSVWVVSYALAFAAFLIVEQPCAALWKNLVYRE